MMITLKDTDSTLLHALVEDYQTQPEVALRLLNALTERLAKQLLLTAIVQLADLKEESKIVYIQDDNTFSPSELKTVNTVLGILYGSSPIKVEVYDNTF